MSKQSEVFRKFKDTLGRTISFYNNIQKSSRKVEFKLIEKEIRSIDALILRGEEELQWRSAGLQEYLKELETLVEGLWRRVKATKDNVEKIRNILDPWTKKPLFERKDRKQETLLSLDDRHEQVEKCYKEIKKAATEIHTLLNENKELFSVEEETHDSWQSYVKYIDDIVKEFLQKSIGCSLSYLAENMDPHNDKEPLFKAKLELKEPDLHFYPSLEPEDESGLDKLIKGLIRDTIGLAQIIPRLKCDLTDYSKELESDEDIKAMVEEIQSGVNNAIAEASDFCETFEGNKII